MIELKNMRVGEEFVYKGETWVVATPPAMSAYAKDRPNFITEFDPEFNVEMVNPFPGEKLCKLE